MENMQTLIEELNKATVAYNNGHPIITDEEWDKKYFQLKALEMNNGTILPNSPTQTIIPDIQKGFKKVKHNHLMLSLDKTKDIQDMTDFIGDEECLFMSKMDGLTCSLTYENGLLVRAETRGNGEIGEDVTANIFGFANIPKVLSNSFTGSIDGEVISTYDNFNKHNQNNEYKNPRNYAAGSLRLLDNKESVNRGLIFVAWDMLGTDAKTLSDKFILLSDLGFTVVPYTTYRKDLWEDALQCINFISTLSKNSSYPIDGVVCKYNNVELYLSKGVTSHHFKGGLAYKFYDETYSSELTDIKWSLGRTGVLTPVAIFKPIDIDGTIVTQANLHNVSILKETLSVPYYGQQIEVFKANQIIPQIASANKNKPDNAKILAYPTSCPICHSEVHIIKNDSGVENFYCTNSKCSGKLITQLDHFCGVKGLDIKGVSVKTLEKLISANYLTKIEDLFNLKQYRQEWIKMEGFGEKSVDKILANIENAQHNCELWKFISALGIPLVGTTVARLLATKYKTWEDFFVQTLEDFYDLDGIGPEINKALINADNYGVAVNIVDRFTFVNSLYEDKTSISNNAKKLVGKTIVVTGKLKNYKRDELKELIIKAGGKLTGSVSKNTDILVNNDVNSTTAKNKKAKELNIPIVTEEDFLNQYIR